MATPQLNNMRTLLPGIVCKGTDNIAITETADCLSVLIEPEMHSDTHLYFIAPDHVTDKKYHLTVNFHHAHAAVRMLGIYHLRDTQSLFIQTTMNHFTAHCHSEQVWRGVLHDAAKAEFEGKIIVHPHAQKTAAHLSNKNLVLSKHASINTKPILEIYADDVKCSHGATVGFLDQDAYFYLRSRGIDAVQARKILIDAFMNEITEAMEAP